MVALLHFGSCKDQLVQRDVLRRGLPMLKRHQTLDLRFQHGWSQILDNELAPVLHPITVVRPVLTPCSQHRCKSTFFDELVKVDKVLDDSSLHILLIQVHLQVRLEEVEPVGYVAVHHFADPLLDLVKDLLVSDRVPRLAEDVVRAVVEQLRRQRRAYTSEDCVHGFLRDAAPLTDLSQ